MQNVAEKKKNYRNYSLDFLKFISALMIVCIHYKVFGAAGEFLTVISRFAVPVFFMISGYYSYEDDTQKTKYKIVNITKIYCITIVLYLVFNVLMKAAHGQYQEAIWYVSTYLRPQYTLKALLFNESLSAIHLWFLGALIYAYLLRYFIAKVNVKDSVVWVVASVLLAIHLALGIGSGLLGVELPALLLKNYILRNFLFMGFPLFAFGQFIKKHEDVILKCITGKYIVLLVLIAVAESVFVYRVDWTKDLYLGSLLLAFAVFVIALKCKDKVYSTKVIAVLHTNTNVYLFHVMIGELLSMTKLETYPLYLYLKPLIIFVLSVLVALCINWIARLCKKKNNI